VELAVVVDVEGFVVQPAPHLPVGLVEDTGVLGEEIVGVLRKRQLGVADLSFVKRYTDRRSTRFEHAEEIRGVLGLRDFAEAEPELTAWVDARSWTTGEGPKAIFTDAVAWLLDRRVLLPGVTTLARLVAQARDGATQRLWDLLYELLTVGQEQPQEANRGQLQSETESVVVPPAPGDQDLVGVIEEERPLQLRPRRRAVVPTVGGRLLVG